MACLYATSISTPWFSSSNSVILETSPSLPINEFVLWSSEDAYNAWMDGVNISESGL